MKAYGIIAEYNPFHNGHRYHIEETRRRTGCDAVAVVMSGDFVQRGEPALLDKWTRAEAALRCGADLVLELPAVFACSSAEHFAFGGVGILEGLGVPDGISFGAEADLPEELEKAAELLAEEPPAFQESLKNALSEGLSFAAARSRALKETAGAETEELIRQPNNILAVEYLKQLRRRDNGMKTLMIPRKTGYFSVNAPEKLAGAGWIRARIRDGAEIRELAGYYPEELRDLYGSAETVDPERLFPLVQYVLRSGERLEEIDGVTEGLENRAVRQAAAAASLEQLLESIKSKRYSLTAVRRMMIRILLKIKKEDMEAFEAADRYAVRVLGFTEKGAELIRQASREPDPKVRLITNVNRQRPEDPLLQKMLAYDSLAADLYDLIKNGRVGEHAEYKMSPVRL
ncbi:MAG: nucleotidyltransferase family protein [Firmicutes bacterium]|nr:nucleotidyltransferase family protein [Bacillota bacterium]